LHSILFSLVYLILANFIKLLFYQNKFNVDNMGSVIVAI
jgi:hypothetical protein